MQHESTSPHEASNRSRPSRFLGVETQALLEIGFFFLFAFSLDQLLLGGTGFAQANPHPYWLVVVLVGVQYGLYEGLLAATCASFAYLVRREPFLLEEHLGWVEAFQMAYTPLLWVTTAFFIGTMRRHQRKEVADLVGELNARETKLHKITSAYDSLAAHKNQLEHQVAGQLNTAIQLYQTAREAEKEEPVKIIVSALHLVESILAPQKASIYLLVNDMLQAGIQEGWEDDDTYQRFFRAQSPLFQEIVARKRFLNAAHPEDEEILLGEGVLAGPLIDPATGEITGMLKIEQLGFLSLTPTNVKSFATVCAWIGSFLAHARHLRENEESSLKTRSGLQSARLYEQYLDFLKNLSTRLNFDVSVVRLQLRNPQQLDGEMLSQTAALVGRCVKEALRFTDFAFDYQRGWCFMILLPGTNAEQAGHVAEKLEAALGQNKQEIPLAEFFIEVEKLA